MSDIFDEVTEEVRKDRAEALWKKYGKFLIVGAVLAVGATAAYQFWTQHRIDIAHESGDAYAAALSRIDADRSDSAPDSAIAQLRIVAESGTPGYAALARLRIAALQQEHGDGDLAAAALRGLAEDAGAPRQLRDLALIKQAMLTIETADPADLGARVAPLAEDGAPWRHSAREVQALLALRGGDIAASLALYQKLVDDPEAPNGLRGRAAEMLSALRGQS